MNRRFFGNSWLKGIFTALIFLLLAIPISAYSADKLIVEGNAKISGSIFAHGAESWGAAPFVMQQYLLNRGVVITDKAATNPKNIYFGWDLTHSYVELMGLQENVAFKNIVLAPSGGNIGIGTTSPSYPLQMGSGAYVSIGGVWTTASSREYKENIKDITVEEAIEALEKLIPVKYNYKVDKEDRHVGFIAEDAPELIATKDRKGLSAMDIVAVLTRVVQEQRKTISELSRKVDIMQQEINRVKGMNIVGSIGVGIK